MTNEERAELTRLRQLEAEEIDIPTASLWHTRAEEAWNAIRPEGDPPWIGLPMETRHKLVHLAEKALDGRPEAEGDYAPPNFFEKVRELGFASAQPISEVDLLKKANAVIEAEIVSDPLNGEERRSGEVDRRDLIQALITHPERRMSGVADRRIRVATE